MPSRSEGAGAATPTPSVTSPDSSGQARGTGVSHRSIETTERPVSGTASTVTAYLLTFAGLAGFLLAIAAVGLAVECLAGIGGLALLAGVFVVVLMVAMRAEGF